MNARSSLLFCISLCILLPMPAVAQPSLYMNGMQYKRNPYASQFEVLPERGMALRYTRVQPTPIRNLDYFWRGSFEGSYEFTSYSGVDGIIHSGGFEFDFGGGLSYRLLSRSRWGLAPFFSVFYAN